MEYPPDGYYRCTYFPKWAEKDICGFDPKNTPFLRQKIEYDVTFSEQMELRTFPVDCQDFSILINEESGVKKCVLMPEPRYTSTDCDDEDRLPGDERCHSNFFSLDSPQNSYSISLHIAVSDRGSVHRICSVYLCPYIFTSDFIYKFVILFMA